MNAKGQDIDVKHIVKLLVGDSLNANQLEALDDIVNAAPPDLKRPVFVDALQVAMMMGAIGEVSKVVDKLREESRKQGNRVIIVAVVTLVVAVVTLVATIAPHAPALWKWAVNILA